MSLWHRQIRPDGGARHLPSSHRSEVNPEGSYCTVSGVGLGAGLLAGGSEGLRLSRHVERSV